MRLKSKCLWMQHPKHTKLWVSQDMEIVANSHFKPTELIDPVSFHRPRGKLLVSKEYLRDCRTNGTIAHCRFYEKDSEGVKQYFEIPITQIFHDTWDSFDFLGPWSSEDPMNYAKKQKSAIPRKAPTFG